jgi:phosphotransferase system enzyme I (PtsI)
VERLSGVGVSSGIAVGPALVAIQRQQVVRFPLSGDMVDREIKILERARTSAHEQLTQIRARILKLKGADLAAIFDAQLLLLDDPMLLGRARALVKDEQVNAEWALHLALQEAVAVFDVVDDPYLRERQGDLRDVVERLRRNLRDEKDGTRDLLKDLGDSCVLIADELSPSIVAQLDWTRIKGFATDAGSRTYHTAILARSLGVPAAVGLHDASLRVPPGAWVMVDGDSGVVTIDPPEVERREARDHPRTVVTGGGSIPSGPTHTADGVAVCLHANIERIADIERALTAGAEGIGLCRSEFILAGASPDLLTEEEQYATYRCVIEGMTPRPVTIRTFDIDTRQLDQSHRESTLGQGPSERHARMGNTGLRGIRFGLARPEVFSIQLRALLRASRHGNLRIMFPFVSSVEEVRQARALLDEARREVERSHGTLPPVPVGVMIEVPAAAITASLLASAVDFFTVGTNDLIQYVLAVDRTDERVLDRYDPTHPAILNLLRQVRRAAARHHLPISVCGEMAADPVLLQFLVGCGLTEFSMTSGAIPMARKVLARTRVFRMVELVSRLRTRGTQEALHTCLEAIVDLNRSSEVSS